MKLRTETLDNYVESVVVNIGKNNGYVEVYIDEKDGLTLFVYTKHGTVVLEKHFSLSMLRDKNASEQYIEQQVDDNSWRI